MNWYKNLYLVLYYYENKLFSTFSSSKRVRGVFFIPKIVFCAFASYVINPNYVFGFTVVSFILFTILDLIVIDKGISYSCDNVGYHYSKLVNKRIYKWLSLIYVISSIVMSIWMLFDSGIWVF